MPRMRDARPGADSRAGRDPLIALTILGGRYCDLVGLNRCGGLLKAKASEILVARASV
jgi:hypothetical protein